jgi:hypothetical protein
MTQALYAHMNNKIKKKRKEKSEFSYFPECRLVSHLTIFPQQYELNYQQPI